MTETDVYHAAKHKQLGSLTFEQLLDGLIIAAKRSTYSDSSFLPEEAWPPIVWAYRKELQRRGES